MQRMQGPFEESQVIPESGISSLGAEEAPFYLLTVTLDSPVNTRKLLSNVYLRQLPQQLLSTYEL